MSLTAVRARLRGRNAQAAASSNNSPADTASRYLNGFPSFNCTTPNRADLALSPRGIRSPVRLSVNIFPQPFPYGVRHLKKYPDHFRIELPPRPLLDFLAGGA